MIIHAIIPHRGRFARPTHSSIKMKTFREFMSEGLVFSAHNGVVLHKLLVRHVSDNMDTFRHSLKSGEYIDIHSKDIHHSLPNDFKIRLRMGKSSVPGNPINAQSGGFSTSTASPSEKHHINLTVGHGAHETITPSVIRKRLGSDSMQRLVVHEHDHLARHRHILKTQGVKHAKKSFKGAIEAADQFPGEKYFNEPGEVRAYSREMALAGRQLKKKNYHGGLLKRVTSLEPHYGLFLDKATKDNITPITNYLKRG